jgi:aminoglycoside phosphotransferase (APT) family kinase protein
MHADEWLIDDELVRRLLAMQFPKWVDLPRTPVASAGTDNALFRLGDDLCLRIPRIPSAAEQLAKEQAWLPVLQGRFAIDIPDQVAVGEPTDGFPWTWSILRWLDGDTAEPTRLTDQHGSVQRLAGFIVELQTIDSSDGPAPGSHNAWRGAPLEKRDTITRKGISAMAGLLDVDLALRVWDDAIAAPGWQGPGTWLHGDLHPANVLCRHGRISAVIDFGCLGVGDPAYDLLAAWTLFDATGREQLRASLSCDDATWARALGWALSFGVMVFPYYRDTNPGLVRIARSTIDQVLADARRR